MLDPGRLSGKVAKTLEDSRNELWLSPISVWELAILCEKGKVLLNVPVATWVRLVRQKVPFREAPITHEVALEAAAIRLPHRDPADRFLAATAKVFELTLVTADAVLIGSKAVPMLANR